MDQLLVDSERRESADRRENWAKVVNFSQNRPWSANLLVVSP